MRGGRREMVGCGPGPPEAWAALPFARAGAAAELPGAPGAASAAEGAATNAPVAHPSAGAAAAFPFAAGLARGCEPAFPFPVGFAAALFQTLVLPSCSCMPESSNNAADKCP